ncbi:MAG: molybdopterin-dependent oxidoreductase [Candidatus Methanofastidiosia archaeon]|jgi:DMSO/TMAO reductase YedYZ molybdopterin-dependent catalytic subunit
MKYIHIILLAALLCGCIGQSPSEPVRGPQESETVPEGVTPIDEFLDVDLGIKPQIDITEYTLVVTGLVDTELVLTYEDIVSFPAVTQITTLYCVTGFQDTGQWTGVPVKYILEKAGYSENTVSVVFYAPDDDYSSSISLEKALQEDTILAYKMNDVTLPRNHGYPLRLVVPDKWGYKWVKWVVKIELVDYEYEGYWESRGYSNIADVPESEKNPPDVD